MLWTLEDVFIFNEIKQILSETTQNYENIHEEQSTQELSATDSSYTSSLSLLPLTSVTPDYENIPILDKDEKKETCDDIEEGIIETESLTREDDEHDYEIETNDLHETSTNPTPSPLSSDAECEADAPKESIQEKPPHEASSQVSESECEDLDEECESEMTEDVTKYVNFPEDLRPSYRLPQRLTSRRSTAFFSSSTCCGGVKDVFSGDSMDDDDIAKRGGCWSWIGSKVRH